jgi:ABC-type glutathione transport system ATPase component
MSPSWPGGKQCDKQGGGLLASAPVRRVSVVGTSGAGKSTLSRALADALDADILELDSVFHQPGWVPLPHEESVIAWAWQTHAATRAKLEAARADQGNSHLEFVRLENPGAVRQFLPDLRR